MSHVSRRPGPRALVVGLGVSGIATAIRLRAIGWTPVIIERAATRRSTGYFVALFGAGRHAARRLGILDSLPDRRPARKENVEIDRAGNKRPGWGFSAIPDRPFLMTRADVERAAFAALPDDVEIRYSTIPTRIDQDDDGVDVTLTTTTDDTTSVEHFDLVVGADGLRSTVRPLVFGPHSEHLHRLNHMIAAYQLPGPLPHVPLGVGANLTEPGRSFHVFPFADGPSTVLFSYRSDDIDAEFTVPPVERLRAAYGPEPLGATLDAAISGMADAGEFLFDSVEEVRLDSWHRGRVVLVGDSAWCLTVYAGMGVSSGLAGADLLGTMLQRHPDDVGRALTAWEARLRSYIDYYQANSVQLRTFLTPADDRGLRQRDLVVRMLRMPVLGHAFDWMGRHNTVSRMRGADIS